MYFNKFPFLQTSIIVISFLSCSVNQAFSLQCYHCTHEDADCFTNPKQSKFVVTCSGSSSVSLNMNFNTSLIQPMTIESLSDKGHKNSVDEWSCNKITGEVNGKKISRDCIARTDAADLCKNILARPDIKDASCDICNTDLCNSSSNLNIGLLSLSLTIITIFLSRL